MQLCFRFRIKKIRAAADAAALYNAYVFAIVYCGSRKNRVVMMRF